MKKSGNATPGHKVAKKRDYNTQAVVANVTPNGRFGMPSRMRIWLRAAASYTAITGASTVSHAIGCNTPNAPFRTVATTNIPGYLTWLQDAYEHAFTIKSRIKIELINTTVADSVFSVLSRDSDTVVSTNIDELAETYKAQSKVMGYFSAGTNSVWYYDEFVPMEALGIAWNSPDNLVTTGDPANPYFWVITIKSSGGGIGNVTYRVTVEYCLEFAQLKAPAP
jgi:hypothetical protein